MYGHLDIYSVQSKAEEFLFAISELKKYVPVSLITGLNSHLVLNNIEVPMKFPICVYAPENRVIMIKENSKFSEDTTFGEYIIKAGTPLTSEVIQEILRLSGIKYMLTESKTMKNTQESNIELPEIWMGADPLITTEAVFSEEKDVTIYPNVKGEIVFEYCSSNQEPFMIDRSEFFALIEFNNKILLPSKFQSDVVQLSRLTGGAHFALQSKKVNQELYMPSMKSVLKERGFNVKIDEGQPEFLNLLQNQKRY